MKRTRKKPVSPYTGILTTPLPDFTPGPLASEKDAEELRAKRVEEEMRRMYALLNHYNIPHEFSAAPWYRLALTLAREHLSAFQPARPKRGPGTLWGDFELACLDVEIRRLGKGKKPATWKSLCAQLEAREPWKSFITRKDMGRGSSYDPGETLYRALRKARSNETVMPWANAAWKAYKYDPKGWPSDVEKALAWAKDHQRERKYFSAK